MFTNLIMPTFSVWNFSRSPLKSAKHICRAPGMMSITRATVGKQNKLINFKPKGVMLRIIFWWWIKQRLQKLTTHFAICFASWLQDMTYHVPILQNYQVFSVKVTKFISWCAGRAWEPWFCYISQSPWPKCPVAMPMPGNLTLRHQKFGARWFFVLSIKPIPDIQILREGLAMFVSMCIVEDN